MGIEPIVPVAAAYETALRPPQRPAIKCFGLGARPSNRLFTVRMVRLCQRVSAICPDRNWLSMMVSSHPVALIRGFHGFIRPVRTASAIDNKNLGSQLFSRYLHPTSRDGRSSRIIRLTRSGMGAPNPSIGIPPRIRTLTLR